MYMASEKLANLRQKIVTRPTLYTYYLVRVHTFSSNWITTSFLPGSRHTLCGKSILKSHIDQVSPSIISLYQFGIRQTTANGPYKKVSRFCNFLYREIINQEQVLVSSTPKDFHSVYEEESWCLCTVAFDQKLEPFAALLHQITFLFW